MRSSDKNVYQTFKSNAWQEVMRCWQSCQPLIEQGYRLLDKEVTMGLPGPCMPAESDERDIGIGSPYGKGAEHVWRFWDKTMHKILLGPGGKTCDEAQHSPYVSDMRPNPFFIPPEKLKQKKLISDDDLRQAYSFAKQSGQIDFEQVKQAFDFLLKKSP